MKITFVLPELNLTGGVRVVATYASILRQKGHDVTVVAPPPKPISLKQHIKSCIKWKGYRLPERQPCPFFDGTNIDLKILSEHRAVTDADVPDADVVIATFWNTAEWVHALSETKGTKVYFLQHHEVHPWLPQERVQETIRLPLKKIVVADWLASVLKAEYGIKNSDIRVVPNAVDHQQFSAEPRQKNKVVRFGFMYSRRAFKGSDLAIECFLALKQKYPGIALIAFGTEPEEELAKYDADIRYLRAPSQQLIPQIYASCDAWLFTSSSEGFGLPILESMACRTPVIGTKTGAAPELLEDLTGFLVDIDDKDALVRGMEKIIEMPASEWTLLSERAFRKSKEYQWDNSTLLFETALKDFVEDVDKG